MAAESLRLDPNRFFDPEPAVRGIARDLYREVKDLPIVSPHGHVDPAMFATDEPFPNPVDLILVPDHYVYRMLYSQGIPLERLGIPARDGTPVETDPRRSWRLFAEHFHLLAGTPTGAWLSHTFHEVFGIEQKLDGETAMDIYDLIDAQLGTGAFRPRALYERFNIEVLTTTDAAGDSLEHHRAIRNSGWGGKVVPCFRPDGVIDLLAPEWQRNIEGLEKSAGFAVDSSERFVEALENRRGFFRSLGAVSTDQGVPSPRTEELSRRECESVFQRALKGEASDADAERFTAHMLMEMARMSVEDGMTMQIHPGSWRNHNEHVFDRFGADRGCDIPVRMEFTRSLQPLLNKYGNDPRLKLVVFTLDETTFSRELAPLAGHYPALRLGPPWWFLDSIEGMTRYREAVTETAGIYNTAGFNDDTRALTSIPARHDLCRRVDANFLARLAARHIIDRADARRMMRALTRDLVKETYGL